MKVVFMSSRSRRRIIELSTTLIPLRLFIGSSMVNWDRQEIGMMRAQLEATKFQIIQWLFGVVTGAGALGLGNLLAHVLWLTGQLIFDCSVESQGQLSSPKLLNPMLPLISYLYCSPLPAQPRARVLVEGKVDIDTKVSLLRLQTPPPKRSRSFLPSFQLLVPTLPNHAMSLKSPVNLYALPTQL